MRKPLVKKLPIPLDGVRLAGWHRYTLYIVVAALTVTGIAWLLLHYFGRQTGEFGVVAHPLEPWSLKLHGFASMLVLFFIGTLLNGHMRRSWKIRRNHISGLILALGMLLLALTGYALYYVAGEEARPVISAIHWIIGLASPVALVAHIVLGRRTRSQS